MKTALLLIDPQNDFCAPDGALFVPGADHDMNRVARLIERLGEGLHDVVFTLDCHVKRSIFHPDWFIGPQGERPAPFTQIKVDDLNTGRWKATSFPERTLEYLVRLERQGEFSHTIWPEHCLIGTEGCAVYLPVMQAILNWSAATRRSYLPVIKGLAEDSEHYGVFQAQVVWDDNAQTSFNYELLNRLAASDRILLAGEALSHCVATSLKQMLIAAPYLASRIILIEDCSSPVPGFEALANTIYAAAFSQGVSFRKSSDV